MNTAYIDADVIISYLPDIAAIPLVAFFLLGITLCVGTCVYLYYLQTIGRHRVEAEEEYHINMNILDQILFQDCGQGDEIDFVAHLVHTFTTRVLANPNNYGWSLYVYYLFPTLKKYNTVTYAGVKQDYYDLAPYERNMCVLTMFYAVDIVRARSFWMWFLWTPIVWSYTKRSDGMRNAVFKSVAQHSPEYIKKLLTINRCE